MKKQGKLSIALNVELTVKNGPMKGGKGQLHREWEEYVKGREKTKRSNKVHDLLCSTFRGTRATRYDSLIEAL